MLRICYLLVPVIFPLLPILGLFLIPNTQRRRRLITGSLLFTLLFSLLAAGLQGSVQISHFSWLDFSLQGSPLGALLSVTLAFLLCLSGLFGFEVQKGRERPYYVKFLLVVSALQFICYAGNLPLLLIGWCIASFSAVLLVQQNQKQRDGFSLLTAGTLCSIILLLIGVMLAGQSGLSLSFLSTEHPATAPIPAVLVLVLGFVLHAVVCFLTPAFTPTTVVLYVGLTCGDLFGIYRVLYDLAGLQPLQNTLLPQILPPVCLLASVAAVLLALRQQHMTRRVSALAASQFGLVLFGLTALQKDLFIGSALLLILGNLCITALLLCCCTFRYTQGRALASELEGVGRQLPLALFCFGCAAFGLVGLPPFAGSASRWYLAKGALSALPWGIFALVLLAVLAGLTALALIRPLNLGFFPGSSYEPDTKMHYGACVGVPLAILTAVILLAGLLPMKILGTIQVAACIFP